MFVVGPTRDERDGIACTKGVVQKDGPNQPEMIIMALAIINPSTKMSEHKIH
jgi:hypothetical protein